MTSSGTSFRNIPSGAMAWPLAPPCLRPILGAIRVFTFTGNGKLPTRSGIRRISRWYHTHVSVSVAVSVKQGNRDTSSKQWCCILRRPLLHSHTSERSSSLTLSQGSRHGNSPKPIPSSPLHRSNNCQVHDIVTKVLQYSRIPHADTISCWRFIDAQID